MPFLQKEDPDLAGMITYLSTGDLPISDRSARTILMLADQFTLDGGVLWHFLFLNDRRKLLPLKQLCITANLKLDILKSFMNKDLAINRQKHCLRELDRNIFGFTYTQIHCCIVGSVRGVLWLRKEHTRIRRHCIVWNHVFLIKFLLIYQVLLRRILQVTGTV